MIRQNKIKQADISGEDVDTHDVAKLTNTILVSLPTHELAANKSPAHELVANKYYPAHELAGKKYENLVLELPAEPSAQEGEGNLGLSLPGQALRERIAVNGRPPYFCGVNFTFKHCCQL